MGFFGLAQGGTGTANGLGTPLPIPAEVGGAVPCWALRPLPGLNFGLSFSPRAVLPQILFNLRRMGEEGKGKLHSFPSKPRSLLVVTDPGLFVITACFRAGWPWNPASLTGRDTLSHLDNLVLV